MASLILLESKSTILPSLFLIFVIDMTINLMFNPNIKIKLEVFGAKRYNHNYCRALIIVKADSEYVSEG